MAKASPQRRVLAMAASQIGYSRWNDSNRGTKYARQTQPVFWPRDYWLLANGISYCDLFVTWVFWKALGKSFVLNSLPGGASYNTDYRASKGGRISKSSARPGDVLVFDWNWNTASTNHVGILEKRLSGNRFQTIEGNTSSGSSGSQSNGGRVARRVRKHSQVRYVIRPDWSDAGGSSSSGDASAQPWETSPRISGMSKAEVKHVQQMLVDAHNDIGKYGVDGSYGEDTFNAVKRVQKALGLTVDGVFGPATEKALAAHIKVAGGKPSKPSKPSSKPTSDRFDKEEVKELQRFLNDGSPRRGGKKIDVDGKAGHGTWEALQHYLGTPVDGKVSNQSYRASEIGNITQGWDYDGPGASGSTMVKALQRWTGVTADGVWGKKTSKALNVKLTQH